MTEFQDEEQTNTTDSVKVCRRRTVFQQDVELRRMVASKVEGIEIEIPDFDFLFEIIVEISPLARCAVKNQAAGMPSDGLELSVQSTVQTDNHWTSIKASDDAIISEISKIEDFRELGCPLLRFRASLKGPCDVDRFSGFIMNFNERTLWDEQVSTVDELYPVKDLSALNEILGSPEKFGTCTRLGVGYYLTKPSYFLSSREQLTLCGIQKFRDGSAIMWATELESWNDHLLPPGDRCVRGKSHIFAVTMVPTGVDTHDVEYILQLEAGGMIPTFATTPVLIESVERLFEYAASVGEKNSSTVATEDELTDDD